MSDNPDKWDAPEHGDAWQLAREHERQKRKSCFWKHPLEVIDGGGNRRVQRGATGVVIGPGEYDSHLCRYEKNSLDKAEQSEHVYNRRSGSSNGDGKTNHERAVELGYLDASGQVQQAAPFMSALSAAILRKQSAWQRSGASAQQVQQKTQTFRSAYTARYGQSLGWLALDPRGWDVGYTIRSEQRMFRSVLDRKKSNRPTNFTSRFTSVERKWGTLPQNFALLYSDSNPGMGAWFPYEHDHHHLIPVGTFQSEVLAKEAGNSVTYMERAAVVMLSHWNIHNQENMMMLPVEIYAAHILDLPAHLPWQMGADHGSYSATIKERLQKVRKRIDRALTAPVNSPEERHEAVKQAAAKIREMLHELSCEIRENLLEAGFHVID